MLKYFLIFAAGILVGRTSSRSGTATPRPEIVSNTNPAQRGFPVSATLVSESDAAMTDLMFEPRATAQPAADPVSAARAYAARVGRIATDASAALGMAQAKAYAGTVANSHDRSLVDESDRLKDEAAALVQAFLTLYARQLAEEAFGIVAASTEELKARAAEMPAATKTVQEIEPVISAAVDVGKAIGKA